MSLGSALSGALSGLQINQRQIDVIANNVANVGTPGYTRKILPQSTTVADGKVVGVSGDTVIRTVDFNLVRDIYTQVSSTSYLDTRIRYLDEVQAFHGPPDKELSVAAEVARLKDSFSALADAPEDGYLLRGVVDQAVDTADKINGFGDLLMQMRNDAQSDMQISVGRINNLLKQIADLNAQIMKNTNLERTTAALADKRDEAVKALSKEMDISFFIRGDNAMVVQTGNGVEIAGDRAETLYFSPRPLDATSFYGDGTVGGIFTGGDPSTSRNSIDITKQITGGTMGALLEMRDSTIPQFLAQLDEMAHKLAMRFDAQGLRLFTDDTGGIPADTPPDPTEDPPVPVTYVGLSQKLRVNQLIIDDNTLIRSGTISHDETVQPGSNEVLRRVVEYTFGDVAYREATGTRDLSADATAGETLQDWLGLKSNNRVKTVRDLSAFASAADLIAAAGPSMGLGQTFRLTFDEPDILAIPAVSLDIDLSTVVDNPGQNFVQDLIDHIDAYILTLPAADQVALADMNVVFEEGTNGEFIINTSADLTIVADVTVAGGMGQSGLEALGLTEMTREAEDPWFEIQIGNHPVKRITIEPGDNENDLLEKLRLDTVAFGGDVDGVPGLAVNQTELLTPGGFLQIRPGDGDAATWSGFRFGGDMKIFGGPFETNGLGTIAASLGLGEAIGKGVGIVEALFGSPSPVTEIEYGSIGWQDASAGTTTGWVHFRENYLGPQANLDTEILGSGTIIDFAQKMINRQSEASIMAEAQFSDEETFQNILERQLLDSSGVNIDEEMSNLISVQNAFASSARVLTAIDEMFTELLNVI